MLILGISLCFLVFYAWDSQIPRSICISEIDLSERNHPGWGGEHAEWLWVCGFSSLPHKYSGTSELSTPPLPWPPYEVFLSSLLESTVQDLTDKITSMHCVNRKEGARSPPLGQEITWLWIWCIYYQITPARLYRPNIYNFLADQALSLPVGHWNNVHHSTHPALQITRILGSWGRTEAPA